MNKIKEFRLKLNYTQESIASKMNVSQAAVASWETGKSLPVANKLSKLAKILDCTIDELFE